jgi:hypothetical protein
VEGDGTRPELPAIGRSFIRLVTHIAPAETTLDVVGGWRPNAGFWEHEVDSRSAVVHR